MRDYKKLLANTDPVFVLFLGACPAVALSGDIKSALGVGIAALIVMMLSALVMALIGKNLTERGKLVSSILVTAFFVSVVSMLMAAFLPGVSKMMGVYLAVLAVDLMVFGVVGNEQSAGEAVKSSLKTGVLFTVAVAVLAALRMLLSGGFIAGLNIAVFGKVSGGLMLFAVELAVIKAISKKTVKEEQ